MSRPRVVVAAALTLARRYLRKRDLPVIDAEIAAGPEDQIAEQLATLEAKIEEDRKSRKPGYLQGRHIQVLTALIAERAPQPASEQV